MRQITLREFRTRGESALEENPGSDLVVLANRKGPAYFLIPVQPGDLSSQERELIRALAKASLRAWQLRARDLGLDQMPSEAVEVEVNASRAARRGRVGPR